MYQIHTTPGFIIDSRERGEAGKSLSIFTRDLGLVFATAQGIRLEKSKLRYHAQDYMFGTFSLVRGKEYWRLTSAQEYESEKRKAKSESTRFTSPAGGHDLRIESRELIIRVASLLRRLLQGEEPHPELFTCVESCLRFLGENVLESEASQPSSRLSDEQMKTLESLTVLRILHALGYIGDNPQLSAYANSNELSKPLLDHASAKRTLMNSHINKALKESHL